MKKFLGYFLGILIITLLIYTVVSGKLTLFIEVFKSRNDKFEYSNEYLINELQPPNANFYYNLLDEDEKKIYSCIAKAVNSLESNLIVSQYEVSDITLAAEDTKIAINAFLADHPEVFYLNSQYTMSLTSTIFGEYLKIELNYIVDNKKDLNNMISKMNSKIEDIVLKVQGMDDYNKELYIHDYLAMNIKYYSEYDEEADIKLKDKYHNAYSALVDGEAVCDGIAKAYQLILGKLGIENYIVIGELNSIPHEWNLVNIDGKWLHVDITSDKYIKDLNGNTIEPVHTYFNVNTEFIKNTHTIEKVDILPISTSNEYTYYRKNNCYIKSSENFESRVTQIVKEQSNRGILEFATDFEINVPGRLLKQLYNINFGNIKNNGNNVTMNYYNEQNVYIVPKK